MREFLVTRFVCATCGETLSASYDAPKNFCRTPDGMPTGASMVQQVVGIEPCNACIRPLREIRGAIKIFNELAQKEQGK